MEKYKKLLAILICIAIIVTFVPKNPVHADALTAGMLGSIAYSVATAAGINFAFTNGTAAGATSWITNQMEQYASGQGMNVVDFFGTDAVLKGTTALVVGKYTYDKIAQFLNDLVQDKNIGTSQVNIGEGAGSEAFNQNSVMREPGETPKATGLDCIFEVTSDAGYGYFRLYFDGVKKANSSAINRKVTGYTVDYSIINETFVRARVTYEYRSGGSTQTLTTDVSANIPAISGEVWYLGASLGDNYLQPQPLPQDKQWEGDFAGTPGFAEPPTDLPDFLSRVPAAVADNQLVVVEEITDVGSGDNPPPTPSPSPTPRPDPNPIPQITIAQKIAAILGEIMGLIGLTGDTPLTEEQQQQIADTAQNIEDSVKDVTQNITDTITQQRTETSYDIQEQTQTLTDGQQQIKDAIQVQTQTITDTLPDIKDAIQDQTQTITDTLPDIKDAIQDQTQTITDTLPDIKDAIQDQTQDITDIKDAIEDATQVPTDFEPQKHPLPRGVFPFCIPFDLHDIIVALDAAPVTPEVHIPFRVPTIMGMNFGLDYTFDLDLHDFDGLAQVLRTLEFIAFGVGLLFVTGKVIKW